MAMPDAPAAPDAPTAPSAPPAPVAGTTERAAPDFSFSEGSYSEQVYLRHPKGEAATPTKPVETAPPADDAGTPPADEPKPEAPLTAEQLAELSDDDFLAHLEKHPKGKERLERLRQNWKGNLEQEVSQRVTTQLAENRARETKADSAYKEYSVLATEKPDVWEAMTTPGSPAYREDVVKFVQQYETWQEDRGKPQAAPSQQVDQQKLAATLLDDWNDRGWKDVKSTLKSEIPYWDKLDSSFRTAVEGDKVGGEKGWWQDTVAGLTKAMDSYYKAQVKEAREAGRNEALSEGDANEGPVTPESPNGKPLTQMSDREILAAYATFGTRQVPRDVYHAAAKRLKLE